MEGNFITTEACKGTVSQTFTLQDNLLTMPVEIATVEPKVSQMNVVKTRVRNCLSDDNCVGLLKIWKDLN